MLHDEKNDLYKIPKTKTAADFIEEKDEYKEFLFNRFRQTRKKFLYFFALILVFGFFLCFLFINGGQYVLTYFTAAVFIGLIVFDVKAYKEFGEESRRFDFRVRSSLERFEKSDVYLVLGENEIKDTISEAYKKYGIKKRWILYFFLIVALIVFAGLGLYSHEKTFTPKKWKNTDERYKFVSDIISDAYISFNGYSDKNDVKYDFSKMTDVEIYALLGKPEAVVSSNHKDNIITKNQTYQEYMGEPLVFTYYFENKAQEVTCEEYYCGTAVGQDMPEWLCFIRLDGELKCAFGSTERQTGYYNNYINRKLFQRDLYGEQKNGD